VSRVTSPPFSLSSGRRDGTDLFLPWKRPSALRGFSAVFLNLLVPVGGPPAPSPRGRQACVSKDQPDDLGSHFFVQLFLFAWSSVTTCARYVRPEVPATSPESVALWVLYARSLVIVRRRTAVPLLRFRIPRISRKWCARVFPLLVPFFRSSSSDGLPNFFSASSQLMLEGSGLRWLQCRPTSLGLSFPRRYSVFK